MSTLQELATQHNWNLPVVCPVCGSALDLSPNHMHLTCTNEFCSSRASGTIAKWCSINGIKELGLTTIEKIQEHGFFSSIGSMYTQLDAPSECRTVMSSELGKNWINIIKEIDAHREMSLAKFIAGYNIAGIGEKQVQKVIDFYSIKDFEGFFWSDSSQRFVCDGIGAVLSQKLSKGLEVNKADMEETIKHIILIKPVLASGKLSGKSFCFTGAMEYKRKDLQDMVTAQGGTNFDSVTKNLTYLVIADPNSTSGKAKKARELGITLISPEQFLEMVNG
jgi:DNA ligase (NAD+)